MGGIILVFAAIAIMVGGFFVMKRLDAFLEANENAAKKEYHHTPHVQFPDTDDYEKMVSDIEKFKTTHEAIKRIIYDGKNEDLPNIIELYDHTGM